MILHSVPTTLLVPNYTVQKIVEAGNLYGSSCIPECQNNGQCLDGRCKCAFGFEGSACETDVLNRYIVIGCLLGAVIFCILLIVAFIIYQRNQDSYARPTPHSRVLSVRNRNLSTTRRDRDKALSDVEMPPDYNEAIQSEHEHNLRKPNSTRLTKSEITVENAGLQSPNKCTNREANSKVERSMSFAARLLETALMAKRKRKSPSKKTEKNLHRSNSTPSESGPSHEQFETNSDRRPTRAISVPGKVVQVTMKE